MSELERQQRVDELFARLLEHSHAQRQGLLRQLAASESDSVLEELSTLLRADDELVSLPGFLSQSPLARLLRLPEPSHDESTDAMVPIGEAIDVAFLMLAVGLQQKRRHQRRLLLGRDLQRTSHKGTIRAHVP